MVPGLALLISITGSKFDSPPAHQHLPVPARSLRDRELPLKSGAGGMILPAETRPPSPKGNSTMMRFPRLVSVVHGFLIVALTAGRVRAATLIVPNTNA